MSETAAGGARPRRCAFPTHEGDVQAVSNLSYTLHRGETLGIVGESGSGKSVSSLALMGLLNRDRSARHRRGGLPGHATSCRCRPTRMRDIRGKDLAMIFQDPFACLHPMYRVGDQIAEAVTAHASVSKSEATERAVELLDAVGIPRAKDRARDYPHQFSGGMRQRAMIAMALVNNPSVLIADEPTTALDVTVQAQILELIERVKREFDIGVVLITHDLGVVAETADTVLVMYAGRRWSTGRHDEIFAAPQHPYTWGLLQLDADDRARDSSSSSRSKARRRRWSTSRPVARSIRAVRTLRAVHRRAAAAPAASGRATSIACHLPDADASARSGRASPSGWRALR